MQQNARVPLQADGNQLNEVCELHIVARNQARFG
jgi:hypothetical protein